jgi:hypothetical protein
MKSFLKYLGLAFIFIGTGLFVALHLLGFTFVNKLMTVPLVLIIGGTVLFVWMLKRQSRY